MSVECQPTGRRNRLKRGPRIVRARSRSRSATSGLDHDHAHVVRDHVVELTGNPLAFLEHCSARAFLALPVHETSLLHEILRVQPRIRAASPTSHATSRMRSVWIRL